MGETNLKALNPLVMSGKEVLPVIEGGKGVAVSTGKSSGAWAAAGGIGTFSAVNADSYDENGNLVPIVYEGKTRSDRHQELVAYGIRGGIAQAQIAHEMRGGEGRLHMNVLWEMGGAEPILHGVLEGAKGLIHGVTCGAGMPYKIAQISAQYGVHYYPIVSSARAFRALWLRAYKKIPEWLGGVVYEDPWRAGGHNGLSNSEDPLVPEDPFPRVAALRTFMNSVGLNDVPIIMAGGVWFLRDFEDWIDNPEVAPVAFQFGTRPLLTKESEISDEWKSRLTSLQNGDVSLHKFSPTGFYSSAVRNDFLEDLHQRSDRQVRYSRTAEADLHVGIPLGRRGRPIYVREDDADKVKAWLEAGYTEGMPTPDDTMVFVTPDSALTIKKDQIDCMGCLSQCQFSNWEQHEGTTGKRADPRSFCIQKTLQNIAHGAKVENELMFAGHNAYKFGEDPFYANGNIPTVKELVDRIMTGD
jgi:NAD(P)H-dependent flavin oxidoreductase YrpB (nitropropane dioxygenase family)